jgi:hypothetical protein
MKAFLLSTLLENVINSMLMPVQLKRNNTGPGDCCGVQHRVGPFEDAMRQSASVKENRLSVRARVRQISV